MKTRGSIYKLLIIGLSGLLLTGCLKPAKTTSGQQEPEEETRTRDFDPLELPRDREVVPEEYPQTGTIRGNEEFITEDEREPADTSGIDIPAELEQVDTVYSQAFRVQLATTKVYGEARHEVRVAEEIFDRPVYLDYEVPYYKVRVGSFRTRQDAEDYQQRARTAGYANAWVVLVNVDIKEPPPLYTDFPIPQVVDTAESLRADTVRPVDSIDVD